MTDPTPQLAPAFRRLRRALLLHRLRRLDPVLRFELALMGVLGAVGIAWRAVRRPPPRRASAPSGCAVVFASHVVETVERLCDRVVVLQLGRVVRTLTRAAWGGPEHGPSPLEREFLSIIQNPPAREDPA